MRRFYLLIVVLSSLHPVLAQSGSITGFVTDLSTGQPVPSANVFLSSASKGTQTNNLGAFVLSQIMPGEYELVASFVGYETFVQKISISNNKQEVKIQLVKKTFELDEVVVTDKSNWARNSEIFKRVFIGHNIHAGKCTILNPRLISFYYDEDKRELTASSEDFLIIENRGLGYRIKYLLKEFEYSQKTGSFFYSGHALYEALPGRNRQVKQWKIRRKAAFLGSSMHFFRSIISNALLENGFVVQSLIKKEVPVESNERTQVNIGIEADSLSAVEAVKRKTRFIRIIGKDTLAIRDLARRTDVKTLFALTCKTDLFVKLMTKQARNKYGPPSNISSAIVLLKERPVLFDLNGVLENPRSLIYSGAWSNGVSDWVPNDYVLGD
jgi:hypothetical protein